MASTTVAVDLARQHWRGRLFVALAAVAWSTAGLFQRELSVGVGTQLAGRAFFAALGLLAYVAIAERGAVVRAFRAIGRGGLAVAALTAVASGTFIVALNHSTVANVLFLLAPGAGARHGRRDARDHAPPTRRLNCAGDLSLAGARARRRVAVRASRPPAE